MTNLITLHILLACDVWDNLIYIKKYIDVYKFLYIKLINVIKFVYIFVTLKNFVNQIRNRIPENESSHSSSYKQLLYKQINHFNHSH